MRLRTTRRRRSAGLFGAIVIVCIGIGVLVWPPMRMWVTERPSLGWSLGFGLFVLLVGLYLFWESQAHGFALVRKRLALAEAEPDPHDQALFDQWQTAFPAAHGSRLWLANFQGSSWLESQSLPIHLLANEWRTPGFVDPVVNSAFEELTRAAAHFSRWLTAGVEQTDGAAQEVATRQKVVAGQGSYRIDQQPGWASPSDARAELARGIGLARALSRECDKFERLAHAHRL